MTILFAWLAGISFVLAVFAVVFAIAEHYRAERVEKALQEAQQRHWTHIQEAIDALANIGRSNADAWKQIAALDAQIRAVASASTPPTINPGQPYIVVPGPRRAQ